MRVNWGYFNMPIITLQPASTAYIVGDVVSLHITASPTIPADTLTYQWYKGAAAIAGATAPIFSISSAVIGDAGLYTCIVTDQGGTATSAVATLALDSIVAHITRNRKSALSAISIVGGYSFTPAVVEEPRLIRNINGRYPYIEITKAPIIPETENNISEHTPISYLVTYEDQYNDDVATDDEILLHFRNVTADIIRGWMVDRTCGALAEFTRAIWYDDAVMVENGLNIYRAAVVFEVNALIDSSNPFLKG
jgi:hypothetical protein